MKKLILAIFIGLSSISLGLAFAQQGTYPQLDISGFKKWEFKSAKVSPQKNYFTGLTQLGGFSPTLTGGPWQERLQLRILGQLSENLSVSYDLEQQPETPDRYDVKVKYYNNELSFGDITANFSGNEFASTSKYINGVMLTAKDGWYDVITIPSAKLKSQTQNLTSQKGNNTKGPYNLGHGSIVEGSEHIELNDTSLARNIDYTIDYFEGKITFNKILTSVDEFKYSYEYTNILDLFFPSLSKRDFFGFQSRFIIDPEEFGRPTPKPEPIIKSTREFYPSGGTVEPEVQEEEASGVYRLKKRSVVNFSERLTFMGTELKKNEDYIIRYAAGEIKLLTRFLPNKSEVLIIEYQHYETSQKSDAIEGIGSRGPYNLSHPHIVVESERIEVDGKLYVRDLDYKINYQTGEIIFGINISETSQIKADYSYNIMVVPTRPESKHPTEIILGTTYLRESAKAGSVSNTKTAIESFSKQDIEDDNNTIYLNNRPVVASDEAGFNVIVTFNGVTLTPEVDYAFPKTEINPATGYYYSTPEAKLAYINDPNDPSDGYQTGTIKFLNDALLNSTTEAIVTVTYTYYKSIVGRYSGVGDGTQGPYYLRNIRNIVPGSERIQAWEQGSSDIVTYTRNSSFEGDAGDTGYSIDYNADNPQITFNKELETTKNFQIIYQYVPPQGTTTQDISQSVFGFDGQFKIGDIFKIETAYAKSDTDRFLAKVPTSESFSGNGKKNYPLHAPEEIIEDTEKVYVNERLLNKDIDYFFSYAKPGQVTFYYIEPTTQDAIRIEYDYQSLSSGGIEVRTKSDYAYKLGGQTKLFGDVLTLGGTTKRIGHDFTPMGGTSIGLGSEYNEYSVKYAPDDFHSFYTNYSYKENRNPISNYEDRYLASYDNSISTGINPNNLLKIDLGYRNYQSLDDYVPGSTTHNNDSLQESYSLGLVPAEWKGWVLAYTQKYDLKKTFSQADSKRDSNNFSESTIDFYHANGNLKATDRISAGYDFQVSEPKTVSLKTSTTEATVEALSSHTRATDLSYNFTLDLTPGFLRKWTARVNLRDSFSETLVKDFNATDEVTTTKNETYHMDLIPINMLTTSLDHNRQETTTLIVDGTNPKTERTSANVRLTPFPWIGGSWSGAQSESIPETGEKNKTTGKSNAYTTTWTPISYSFVKLSSNYKLSDNIQTAPSGTTEGVRTNTNTFSQGYNMNVVPHPIVPLTFGYSLENYKNKNDHPIVSSQIDTETENKTTSAGITIIPMPSLSLSSNISEKVTQVIKDLKASPEARTKTIVDSKVTYKVASWGTLVYNRQDEDNRGEVQSGSMADLDLHKTTETYSLNISIPVDNPVLTSFVFIASIKTVDYKNRKNSDDDFKATLTSFEGSLNF